jgi:hypothetical protein
VKTKYASVYVSTISIFEVFCSDDTPSDRKLSSAQLDTTYRGPQLAEVTQSVQGNHFPLNIKVTIRCTSSRYSRLTCHISINLNVDAFFDLNMRTINLHDGMNINLADLVVKALCCKPEGSGFMSR